MERTSKIILLAAVGLVALIGLGSVAYGQMTGASINKGQCGSMIASGNMGGTNQMGMMGQSSSMEANCQSMMSQHDAAQCQSMGTQNMSQLQEMMREQNMKQSCR